MGREMGNTFLRSRFINSVSKRRALCSPFYSNLLTCFHAELANADLDHACKCQQHKAGVCTKSCKVWWQYWKKQLLIVIHSTASFYLLAIQFNHSSLVGFLFLWFWVFLKKLFMKHNLLFPLVSIYCCLK